MLKKITTTDLIEVTTGNVIQVRQKIAIVEDGKELSFSYHRYCLLPGDSIYGQDDRIKKIAEALWVDLPVSENSDDI